jgi:hypothetical protein
LGKWGLGISFFHLIIDCGQPVAADVDGNDSRRRGEKPGGHRLRWDLRERRRPGESSKIPLESVSPSPRWPTVGRTVSNSSMATIRLQRIDGRLMAPRVVPAPLVRRVQSRFFPQGDQARCDGALVTLEYIAGPFALCFNHREGHDHCPAPRGEPRPLDRQHLSTSTDGHGSKEPGPEGDRSERLPAGPSEAKVQLRWERGGSRAGTSKSPQSSRPGRSLLAWTPVFVLPASSHAALNNRLDIRFSTKERRPSTFRSFPMSTRVDTLRAERCFLCLCHPASRIS